MWQGRTQTRCRRGRGEPSPSADVGGVSRVPVQVLGNHLLPALPCRLGHPAEPRRCRAAFSLTMRSARPGGSRGLARCVSADWPQCNACGVWTAPVGQQRPASRTCGEPADASGLGSPPPHLRRDWAHPCHICAGTGLTPCHVCTGTGWAPAHPAVVKCRLPGADHHSHPEGLAAVAVGRCGGRRRQRAGNRAFAPCAAMPRCTSGCKQRTPTYLNPSRPRTMPPSPSRSVVPPRAADARSACTQR